MNRTIKEATVKRCRYGSYPQIEKHFSTFLDACNFAKGKTPVEEVVKWWMNKPEAFSGKPDHVCMGPNKFGENVCLPCDARVIRLCLSIFVSHHRFQQLQSVLHRQDSSGVV